MRRGSETGAGNHDSGGLPRMTGREVDREVRRFFRRFIEPGAYAACLDQAERDGGTFGLFVPRNRWTKPVLRVEGRYWCEFERRDLVQEDVRIGRWIPSAAGTACFRRLEAAEDGFRSQHQLRGSKLLNEKDGNVAVRTNEAENPLGWLHRRIGPDGKPLISDAQYAAGERFRADYTLARLDPRVTMDWSMALGPGGRKRQTRGVAEISDQAMAARTRFAKALDAAGSGLSGVLIEICCNQLGLEEVERRFGWPRRSGKVVLCIALNRLAVHYGL